MITIPVFFCQPLYRGRSRIRLNLLFTFFLDNFKSERFKINLCESWHFLLFLSILLHRFSCVQDVAAADAMERCLIRCTLNIQNNGLFPIIHHEQGSCLVG